MHTITNAAELKNAIQQLKQKQAAEWPLLKEEFLNTYESLKLINIIKSTFKEAVTVPDLKTNVIKATVGLTTGIIVKKLMIGNTINPLKKLLGIILELAVAGKVSNNMDGIRSLGNMIGKKIFTKQNDSAKT